MLFLQLPPVHSPSTARPPDPDLRSRSSISSLLPCYFCSSRPSTARPPPVHRILTFDLAPPSLASSHAISAPAARPQPVHRPSTGSWPSISLYFCLPCYFCTSSPSTARPPPVHRILTFDLAPPSLASSHAISAPAARPQPVHRPSTGSWPSISLYFCSSRPSTARPPPVHRILTFDLAPPSLASSHAISAPPARPQPVHRPSTARPPDPDLQSRSSISSLLPCYFCSSRPSTARPPPVHQILTFDLAPPSLASSHAISAAPARPQPVHRPSTGSWHSISLLP